MHRRNAITKQPFNSTIPSGLHADHTRCLILDQSPPAHQNLNLPTGLCIPFNPSRPPAQLHRLSSLLNQATVDEVYGMESSESTNLPTLDTYRRQGQGGGPTMSHMYHTDTEPIVMMASMPDRSAKQREAERSKARLMRVILFACCADGYPELAGCSWVSTS